MNKQEAIEQEAIKLLRENGPTIDYLCSEVKEVTGAELKIFRVTVATYANEAIKLDHNQIDTVHLLLALVHEGRGIAVEVLRRLDVNLEKLEMKVKAMIKPIVLTDVEESLEFTNASKQVLQYAAQEAKKVESDYACAEHILLGLIREKNGIAAKALTSSGVTLEGVRELLDPRPMLKFQHRSRQLNLNNVDKAIRDLVYLLNEASFLETSSSCGGHPDYYRTLIRTDEWREGGIHVDPTGDVGPVWDFLEFLRARLDNTRGLELSQRAERDKEQPHIKRTHVYRTSTLFKQIDGEALYASAIPILTTWFWSLIQPRAPSVWNIVLSIIQEFISSSEILPSIETPEAGAETFVRLLQSLPQIQEIAAWDYQPPSNGRVAIYFLWNRASIQWGWDFINHLKTRLEDELDKPGIHFRTSFAINPIVKRGNIQRTREDHLNIWKLIELAAREYIHGASM